MPDDTRTEAEILRDFQEAMTAILMAGKRTKHRITKGSHADAQRYYRAIVAERERREASSQAAGGCP